MTPRDGIRALLAGRGALEALGAPGPGQVVAWSRAACYVDLAGRLLALTRPGTWEGPLHLALDRPVPRSPAGAPVELRGGAIRGPRWTVRVAGARPWSGPLPPPQAVRTGADLLRRVLAEVAAGSRMEPLIAARAEELLGRGALEEVGDLLAGRGPGLTPAGDDALAGILLVARASAGPAVEPRLSRIAAGARTTAIARAFLRWAARGQSIRPAHELLVAAARGDAAATARWAAALGAVGASSGADLAAGMRWACGAATPR